MTPKINMRIEILKNGGIPEGYKKTKYGVFPSNWKIDKLGNYLTEYRELSNDIETYPVYSSSRKGLLPQSQYYDKREAVTTNLGYKIVPDGYVTYRHMSDDDIFHFNQNTTGDSILVSSEYPVFSCNKNSNLYFIITLLNESPRFRHYCRMQKMGGTRTRLYYKNLCHYITCFPSLEEQQRIASILSAQDKVIECYEKKIDQLKQMKKHYLQNMFPKYGEKMPNIRFKGFTDPWIMRKFSDCSWISGKRNKDAIDLEPYSITNEHGFIRQSEAHDEFAYMKNTDRSAYIIVTPNSFAYNPARINVGSIGYYTGSEKIMVSSLYEVFQTADYVDDRFLWQWFKTDVFSKWVVRLQEGSVRLYFYYDKLCECSIYMPSKKEQRIIAEFLDIIDKNITLHQHKLEEEKRKKQSLQQLLLTGIVRV